MRFHFAVRDAWWLPTAGTHGREAAAWWLAGAVAALHFAFARASVAVPYVFGDEAGYLTKAAAIAGVATDAYSSYYPGYALWLAPLYAITPDTLAIYPWIQGLNALLAGACAWLLLGLAWKVAPDRPASIRWMAAAAVACYAPTLAYSAFALSENLFIPGVLLLAVLLLREVARPELGNRVAIMLAGAGLMLTHPKGVPVMAALCLGWLVGAWPRSRQDCARALGWTAGGVLLFVCLHKATDAFFRHRMGYYGDGVSGHYPGAGALLAMFAQSLRAGHIRTMAEQLAGQLLYLGVATFGLALVGLSGWRGRFRQGPAACDQTRMARAYGVFACASLVLTMLMTAFFMQDAATRVDAWFYGRYDEGVVGLVMLAALLHPPGRRVWWLAAAALGALGFVLTAAHGSEPTGEVVELNVFGAQLWRFLGAVGNDHVNIVALAVAGSISIVLMGWLARSIVLPITMGALFLLAAFQGSAGYLRPSSEINASRHRIPDRIHRDFAGMPCVDYDIHASEYWQRFNEQVLLLPVRIHETAVSPSAAGQPDDGRTHARCSDLVISTATDLARRYPVARLLESESGSQEKLWWIPREKSRHARQ